MVSTAAKHSYCTSKVTKGEGWLISIHYAFGLVRPLQTSRGAWFLLDALGCLFLLDAQIELIAGGKRPLRGGDRCARGKDVGVQPYRKDNRFRGASAQGSGL